MRIQIGRRPDHDFDQPLGLLSDCHRRIEHFLEVLATIANRRNGGPLTSEDRTALEDALRYFSVAAPRHTADEEASLFPRLRESGDPGVASALALLDALERDHDEADQHHAAVEQLVRRWLRDHRLPAADATALRDHLDALQALYRRHIATEDHHLFPAAARVLDEKTLRDIGHEMAERRHVRRGRG